MSLPLYKNFKNFCNQFISKLIVIRKTKQKTMRAPLTQLAGVAVPDFVIYSFFCPFPFGFNYCCGIDSFTEICTLKTGIYRNSVFKWHWKTATLKGRDDEEINLRQVFLDKEREQRLLAFICQKSTHGEKWVLPIAVAITIFLLNQMKIWINMFYHEYDTLENTVKE